MSNKFYLIIILLFGSMCKTFAINKVKKQLSIIENQQVII